MKKLLTVFACTSLLSFTLVSALAGTAGATAGTSAVIDTTSPIKHVVVIYQENHTFDNVLGAVCQTRAVACNGYTGPVTFADGITATNNIQSDIVPDRMQRLQQAVPLRLASTSIYWRGPWTGSPDTTPSRQRLAPQVARDGGVPATKTQHGHHPAARRPTSRHVCPTWTGPVLTGRARSPMCQQCCNASRTPA
jgi:hypothetical protein